MRFGYNLNQLVGVVELEGGEMAKRDVFEKCVQFVSDLEERESELIAAEKFGVTYEDDDLNLLVIQKLLRALSLVKDDETVTNQSKVLFHISEFADVVQKPKHAIPWCLVIIKESATPANYRQQAEQLLVNIKLKLPADMYESEVQSTKLSITHAMENAKSWLERQERHASQPSTKHVFNSGFITKKKNKPARDK